MENNGSPYNKKVNSSLKRLYIFSDHKMLWSLVQQAENLIFTPDFFESVNKNVDKSNPGDILNFDFQKALDRGPHQRCLSKFRSNEMRNSFLLLFKNMLNNSIRDNSHFSKLTKNPGHGMCNTSIPNHSCWPLDLLPAPNSSERGQENWTNTRQVGGAGGHSSMTDITNLKVSGIPPVECWVQPQTYSAG